MCVAVRGARLPCVGGDGGAAVTMMLSGTSLDWPSELVTVTYTVGTMPVKPGAGVKVKAPSARTSSAPTSVPVSGSTICVGPGPGGSGLDMPGKRIPEMTAVDPAGGTTCASRLPVTGSSWRVVVAFMGGTVRPAPVAMKGLEST